MVLLAKRLSFALVVAAALIVLIGSAEAQRVDHPPIVIESDEDFLLPGSGVVGGLGTPENPYLIKGWRLTKDHPLHSNEYFGVEVSDVSAAFRVEDVEMVNFSNPISIHRAKYVELADLDLGDTWGINAWSVDRLSIEDTIVGRVTFYDGGELVLKRSAVGGLHVQDVRSVSIDNSSFLDHWTHGVYLNADTVSIRDSRASDAAGHGVLLSDVVDVSISGLLLERIAAGGLIFLDAVNATLSRIVAEGNGGTGIRVGAQRLELRDIETRGNADTGFYVESAGQAVMADLTSLLDGLDGTGVRIIESQDVTMQGITVKGTGRGVSIEESSDVIIDDLNIVGTEIGIMVHDSRDIAVAEARITEVLIGITVNGRKGLSESVTLTDVVIETTGREAISVRDTNGFTLRDFDFRSNLTLTGGQILDSSGVIIEDGFIRGDLDQALSVRDSSDVVVRGVTSESRQAQFGGGLMFISTEDVEVSGSSVTGSGMSGILLDDCRSVVLRDNFVAGWSKHGIVVRDDCDDVVVEGNEIHVSGGRGIVVGPLQEGAEVLEAQVLENEIVGSGWVGIAVSSREGVIRGNDITGNFTMPVLTQGGVQVEGHAEVFSVEEPGRWTDLAFGGSGRIPTATGSSTTTGSSSTDVERESPGVAGAVLVVTVLAVAGRRYLYLRA